MIGGDWETKGNPPVSALNFTTIVIEDLARCLGRTDALAPGAIEGLKRLEERAKRWPLYQRVLNEVVMNSDQHRWAIQYLNKKRAEHYKEGLKEKEKAIKGK